MTLKGTVYSVEFVKCEKMEGMEEQMAQAASWEM